MICLPHPIHDLRAARADLLVALQARTATDLLAACKEGEPCGRDVLLHITAWLYELAVIVPDLALRGCAQGGSLDAARAGAEARGKTAQAPDSTRTVRPETAIASMVTAHMRLLAAVERIDDEDLRRAGPTRFGSETSGWDLLVAEAAHERMHAALLGTRGVRTRAMEQPCCPPAHLLHAS